MKPNVLCLIISEELLKRTAYPITIYLIGLAITLVYAFSNNYTTVSDTAREYQLYLQIAESGHWQHAEGMLALQSSCLSTTLFPALLQRLLHTDPLLTFKLYACLLSSLLPVAIHLLASRFTSRFYAFLAAVFFMGQVTFTHAPSLARFNIALLFFVLSLLLILHLDMRSIVKFPILLVLSIGIVVSHYSTTFIALFLFVVTGGLVILWHIWGEKLPHGSSVLIVCLSLIAGIAVWYGIINQDPYQGGLRVVKNIIPSVTTEEFGVEDVVSRDKITQAAFGVKNPDGDTDFSFNWATLVFGWLTVMIMSYGLLVTVFRWSRREEVPFVYLLLSMISYAIIVGVVISPSLSRAYGIERTYQHGLVFLALYFITGCSDIAQKLHLKPYMVILPVLVPYLYYIYTTGIIHSIRGA